LPLTAGSGTIATGCGRVDEGLGAFLLAPSGLAVGASVTSRGGAVKTPSAAGRLARHAFAFVGLWLVNLLAAYAPALLCVPGLPGDASDGRVYLYSPVVLAGMMLPESSDAGGWLLLLALFLLLGLASALSYWSRWAWAVVPGVVFTVSLVQGSIVAAIVRGI